MPIIFVKKCNEECPIQRLCVNDYPVCKYFGGQAKMLKALKIKKKAKRT